MLDFEAVNDISRIGNQSRFVRFLRKVEQHKNQTDAQVDNPTRIRGVVPSLSIRVCTERLPSTDSVFHSMVVLASIPTQPRLYREGPGREDIH